MALLAVPLLACDDVPVAHGTTDAAPVASRDNGSPIDGSPIDGSPIDGSPIDGSPIDGSPIDGSPIDGSPIDAGADAVPADAAPLPELPDPADDVARFVDPLIGTAGPGNVIPGALVPHGRVRLSPVTVAEAGPVAAYDFEAPGILGFSHTHLEGAGGGANGYSQLLVSPVLGALTVDAAGAPVPFSHDDEIARPGYYAVTLGEPPGIRAELTATGHAAIHRYRFPDGQAGHIVVDLGRSLGRSLGGEITQTGDRVLEGFAEYQVHPLIGRVLSRPAEGTTTGVMRLYFSVRFDRPIGASAVWHRGRDEALDTGSQHGEGRELVFAASFPDAAGQAVELRVGVSMIDVEQARRNREIELGDRSFEHVARSAYRAWNDRLRRVLIEADDEAKTIFYTALYHAMFQPADYTEPGTNGAPGRYFSAWDGRGAVFPADGARYYTDDWCLWDTYRTSAPLRTLVEPEIVADVVRSLLHADDQGGWLPKCPWAATGYSRVMTGNPAISIIADAWLKGLSGFDADAALDAMVHLSTEDDNPYPRALCGYLGLGTPPEYVERGWVSRECDPSQDASLTLELAYADWCLARMAEALDRPDIQATFDARAQSFRNQWDPEVGFMRGRTADGEWVEPFDPADTGDANDFVEASAWIFSFFVPHDVPALVELMGGREAFVERLDQFFEGGHFDASNQPSFHIPYLYDYAGAPASTQARVAAALDAGFHAEPRGLPGNDDAGSMSAWYVFGALGLYPVAPASLRYRLTAPRHPRAEIALNPALQGGERFVIEAPGAERGDRFIQSVRLNGEALDRTWIGHDEIVAGGTLVIELGPEPSSWGAASP